MFYFPFSISFRLCGRSRALFLYNENPNNSQMSSIHCWNHRFLSYFPFFLNEYICCGSFSCSFQQWRSELASCQVENCRLRLIFLQIIFLFFTRSSVLKLAVVTEYGLQNVTTDFEIIFTSNFFLSFAPVSIYHRFLLQILYKTEYNEKGEVF